MSTVSKRHVIVLTIWYDQTSCPTRNPDNLRQRIPEFLHASRFNLKATDWQLLNYQPGLLQNSWSLILGIKGVGRIQDLASYLSTFLGSEPRSTLHLFNTSSGTIRLEQRRCAQPSEAVCICEFHRMHAWPLVRLDWNSHPQMLNFFTSSIRARGYADLMMPNTPTITHRRVIFVKNIPYELHNQRTAVRDFMSRHGAPVAVHFPKSRDRKVWVLVEYSTYLQAQQSKAYYNGCLWGERKITTQDADEDSLPPEAFEWPNDRPIVANGITR